LRGGGLCHDRAARRHYAAAAKGAHRRAAALQAHEVRRHCNTCAKNNSSAATRSRLSRRLGIDDALIGRLARARRCARLRPGVSVRADVLADGTPKSLSFLTGRDTLVRIVPQGERFQRAEEQAALETRVLMRPA